MTDDPDTAREIGSHPVSTLFRVVLAIGAFGLAAGGIILIGEGLFHIADSVAGHLRGAATASFASRVMKATDELLFGIVLTIFAANIAFGFCMDAAKTAAYRVPAFMSASSISELKTTFCQVVVVYLIVDFATDIIADADKLDVKLLYFPAAIALISAALWLLPHDDKHDHRTKPDPEPQGRHGTS